MRYVLQEKLSPGDKDRFQRKGYRNFITWAKPLKEGVKKLFPKVWEVPPEDEEYGGPTLEQTPAEYPSPHLYLEPKSILIPGPVPDNLKHFNVSSHPHNGSGEETLSIPHGKFKTLSADYKTMLEEVLRLQVLSGDDFKIVSNNEHTVERVVHLLFKNINHPTVTKYLPSFAKTNKKRKTPPPPDCAPGREGGGNTTLSAQDCERAKTKYGFYLGAFGKDLKCGVAPQQLKKTRTGQLILDLLSSHITKDFGDNGAVDRWLRAEEIKGTTLGHRRAPYSRAWTRVRGLDRDQVLQEGKINLALTPDACSDYLLNYYLPWALLYTDLVVNRAFPNVRCNLVSVRDLVNPDYLPRLCEMWGKRLCEREFRIPVSDDGRRLSIGVPFAILQDLAEAAQERNRGKSIQQRFVALSRSEAGKRRHTGVMMAWDRQIYDGLRHSLAPGATRVVEDTDASNHFAFYSFSFEGRYFLLAYLPADADADGGVLSAPSFMFSALGVTFPGTFSALFFQTTGNLLSGNAWYSPEKLTFVSAGRNKTSTTLDAFPELAVQELFGPREVECGKGASAGSFRILNNETGMGIFFHRLVSKLHSWEGSASIRKQPTAFACVDPDTALQTQHLQWPVDLLLRRWSAFAMGSFDDIEEQVIGEWMPELDRSDVRLDVPPTPQYLAE